MVANSKLSEKFDTLLDLHNQEHVIEVLRDWAGVPDTSYTEHDAKTVETEIIDPLNWWIEKQGDKHSSCSEVQAAAQLIECAQSDIAYGFRYRQKISAAQISRLDELWKEFQRVLGGGVMFAANSRRLQVSKRQSYIARHPRRAAVTKSELDKFRAAFEKEKGSAWGWKVAACKKFNIDRKTLNKKISEE